MNTVTIPASEALRSRGVVRIRITGLVIFRLRLWLGLHLHRLAALVGGYPCEISYDEEAR